MLNRALVVVEEVYWEHGAYDGSGDITCGMPVTSGDTG